MKKLSTSKSVIKILTASETPVPVKDLITKTNRPAKQVYAAVYILKKEGVITKTSEGYSLGTAATAPKTTDEKPNKAMAKLERDLAQANEEIERLNEDLRTMSVRYLEAQVVIKYLESRNANTREEG